MSKNPIVQRPVKIHNTLTRTLEEFVPKRKGMVHFYSCGPTTYDYLHVGNARALLVGDLIYRILRYVAKYEVNFVRNFTDVDDKIIQAAEKLSVDPIMFADHYVKECEVDMERLNMLQPTHSPKVTDHINEIIVMVETLIEKGIAYVVEGEVLYHVPAKSDYGKLSNRGIDSGDQNGIRIEVEAHKKHPSDFVLWKPAKPGEPFWVSPWGKGRPGWHIECSAMAKKYLGEELDLHHGGIDLIFPHHENEIAQSESANGTTFCKCWAHHEFVNFATEKMSKSLGNVVTMREFMNEYTPLMLRYLLLSMHYRTKLDWNSDSINRSFQELLRLHEFYKEWEEYQQSFKEKIRTLPGNKDLLDAAKQIPENLLQDFHVPDALANFFTLIRLARNLMKDHRINEQDRVAIDESIEVLKFGTGLLQTPSKVYQELRAYKLRALNITEIYLNDLLQERRVAKQTKDYKKADEVRQKFLDLGLQVKDHPDGSATWDI
ncbi:MAG: cysteine--tRNA ligase [Bacteriovoracaceae bacterium]|nr:cysteine--tRNA ligase [Bacteriovoracaceae bacterium]